MANGLSNTVSVLLGNGDGTFQVSNFGVGTFPDAVAIADLNGDGKPDLVVSNINSSTVSVLLGNGSGNFQVSNFAVGAKPNGVAVSDLNGDGRPDIVTVNAQLDAHTFVNDVAAFLNVPPTQQGSSYSIDKTPPTVSSVAASGTEIVLGNGDIDTSHTVTFTLSMSEAVTVDTTGGSPTLTLDDGGTAAYAGVSGGNALTFTYTVASGDTSSDLQVTKFNANSAVISDVAGNAANMSGAVANPPGILQVDTTPPAITIGTIALDDTINKAEAGAPVTIGGTASGAEDEQPVTVKILDAQSHLVDSFTTGVSAGAWSVSLTSAQAQALADGTYTVTADVSDRAPAIRPPRRRARSPSTRRRLPSRSPPSRATTSSTTPKRAPASRSAAARSASRMGNRSRSRSRPLAAAFPSA